MPFFGLQVGSDKSGKGWTQAQLLPLPGPGQEARIEASELALAAPPAGRKVRSVTEAQSRTPTHTGSRNPHRARSAYPPKSLPRLQSQSLSQALQFVLEPSTLGGRSAMLRRPAQPVVCLAKASFKNLKGGDIEVTLRKKQE